MGKKIIMILSRVFPVTHSRRGEPTDFASKLASGEKKHTIRSKYDLWRAKGELMEGGKFNLSIRQWSGKPYGSPQVEIARYDTIGVQAVELYYHADNDTITAKVDGHDVDCCTLAKNDGLSVQDFKEWFFGKGSKGDKFFEGGIIHFTNIRYGK
jgi:hypothetical protein